MRILLGVMMVVSLSATAQEYDSVILPESHAEADTVSSYSFTERPDDKAEADTSIIGVRQFDQKTIDQLKADPALQYDVTTTVGESLWTRFWRWVGDWLAALFDGATTTNWGRLFAYTFLLLCVVAVVLMMLRVNAYRVFYGDGASPKGKHSIDENIHEMDFEKLIQEALSRQDYRLSVRLIFLYALKMLSDKNHIHWMQGKTNQDYLNELASGEIKNGFSDLNYFFEYAWYGNFDITDGVYAKVKSVFDRWRSTI